MSLIKSENKFLCILTTVNKYLTNIFENLGKSINYTSFLENKENRIDFLEANFKRNMKHEQLFFKDESWVEFDSFKRDLYL